ncbi:hypothetical protein H310_00970 [Aphanomyces invadans]|uniref:Uncharacterized protein n=1 Tax=Aphanomyces invadans TaxID=157072 RepID=A0A024UPL6_9STRA|nr:hypothetical protein H310_00970 [Aphanomyces invadans]ETW08376.1 hypothetical protein H310_00970 [Aphanomyces invadans]|eukprot:XP_008862181.1 hypothetical protein H310_00970 [Aphanomyces invadans]
MDDAHEIDSYATDHHQCLSSYDAAWQDLECSLLSNCRSVSRSLVSTERSSVIDRVTTLWSKYAVALNDIEHIHIETHKIVRCDDAPGRSTVVYSLDVYLTGSDIGLQNWLNRLLFVTRHLMARGSASVRCDGFSSIMYTLKDFLLGINTRQSIQLSR